MVRENVVLSKSKCFAVCIMQLVQYLGQNRRPYFIIDQIGRSGTSIGANVTEAQHAISEKEFLQKMYIAYKEAVRHYIGSISYMHRSTLRQRCITAFQRSAGNSRNY